MENANYIVAMFNDLLSRFSKARNIKCFPCKNFYILG